MHAIVLKPGREKSLKRRHPWVFSGAVARVEGEPGGGDTIEVRSATGEVLGLAAYSPHSQIRARVWTWARSEIAPAFFVQRVQDAARARHDLGIEAASNA